MDPRRSVARLLNCCLAAALPAAAQPATGTQPLGPAPAQQVRPVDAIVPGKIDLSGVEEPDASGSAPKPLRFTVAHEGSYRVQDDPGIVNNRSWFRLEYSKLFLDHFFVQLDTKFNAYWKQDHRAKAEDRTLLVENITPEAFVQYSGAGGRTSVKVGVQRLIWGESEAGAITDEVSPRNLSELFLIPLEEARLGQFMVAVDHFSPAGDSTFFFVPEPKFNKYPKGNTAYFVDPFAGRADVRDDFPKRRPEYGMRWKKTFGKSDVSLMAASLIDNDYAWRLDSVSGTGRLQVSRLTQRFRMGGATFNFAQGKFLIKGEVAFKSPKAFNDADVRLLKKSVIDSSLGVTYSLGDSNTLGLELVDSHVRDWSDRIVGVPRNTTSLVLNNNFFFLNDRLSLNWLTVYSRPYTSVQSSVRTSYKWSDNTTFSVDAHLIGTRDPRSRLYPFRGQDQIVFRVKHQF